MHHYVWKYLNQAMKGVIYISKDNSQHNLTKILAVRDIWTSTQHTYLVLQTFLPCAITVLGNIFPVFQSTLLFAFYLILLEITAKTSCCCIIMLQKWIDTIMQCSYATVGWFFCCDVTSLKEILTSSVQQNGGGSYLR